MSMIGSSGKSGAFFFMSNDKNYYIKGIRKDEFDSFISIIKSYYGYLKKNPKTFILKFFGFHRMKIYKKGKMIADNYYCVMKNIMNTPKQIHRMYDLKGSTYGRSSKLKNGKYEDGPRKDLDIIADNDLIAVESSTSKIITQQLRCDADFLKRHQFIDYSMLIGIHELEEVANSVSKHEEHENPFLGVRQSVKSKSIVSANIGSFRIMPVVTPKNRVVNLLVNNKNHLETRRQLFYF